MQYAIYGCDQCPERREWVDELAPLWWTPYDWWPVCHGCQSSEHVHMALNLPHDRRIEPAPSKA